MHVAPKALVWRKKGEGLIITAKGSKDLAAGKRLHVMVAIACNKGVILCKPHDKNEWQFLCVFHTPVFQSVLGESRAKKKWKTFICSGQQSISNIYGGRELVKTYRVQTALDTTPFTRHILHLVKNLFKSEAIQENITCETFEQFKTWALRAIKNVDPRPLSFY